MSALCDDPWRMYSCFIKRKLRLMFLDGSRELRWVGQSLHFSLGYMELSGFRFRGHAARASYPLPSIETQHVWWKSCVKRRIDPEERTTHGRKAPLPARFLCIAIHQLTGGVLAPRIGWLMYTHSRLSLFELAAKQASSLQTFRLQANTKKDCT